jgi:hypothetical protein
MKTHLHVGEMSLCLKADQFKGSSKRTIWDSYFDLGNCTVKFMVSI